MSIVTDIKPATEFLPRLLRQFLPIALLICFVGFIFYISTAAEDETALAANEQDHIHAASENVKRTWLSLTRDTALLANLHSLKRALHSSDAADWQEAKLDFMSFVESKHVYCKARWIDETGRERLRVEMVQGHARALPLNQGESKVQRYYFQESMRIAKDAIYLSPIDLEVDEGVIEQPLHPVVRAATRVFDERGRPRGIVVLTYEADDLFKRIDRVASSVDGGWMLVDQQGYWLHSPQAADEFGAQLSHRRSMATRYPQAWQAVQRAPAGQFKDSAGDWWLYEDVLPDQAIVEEGQTNVLNLHWKLLKHVEAGRLTLIHRPLFNKTLLVVALVLGLALLVSSRLARSQLLKDKREAELHQALHELEQQKFALDQHAIVSISDVRGTITYVNDKFCAISRYARAELIGQNHRLLNSGTHDAEFFRAMYRVIEAGKVWVGEICDRAKDGSLYWVNTTIVPLLDDHGRPQHYAVICTDITQTKLHETMLEEAQRLGKLGHWQLDLNSNKLVWSKELFRIFEIDPEQFGASYEAFLQLVHSEDRELVDRSFRDSVDNHRSYAIEHRLLFPDGRIKWVSEYGSTHYDDQGKPVLSLGTVQDITERKLAEEKLRISSIAFETQEAIIVTDADAKIISVNHSFEKLTGYSANEAIGQNPSILQSGRNDAEFYRSMWYSLRENGSWSGEMWDKRKDGTFYPKWLTITTVRNEAGQITHYVAIFMDISERKRAEEEIHRLAFYDTLTQLPNRRLLMDRLDQALAASQRSGSHGALMFMDLDNFKALNDTQGHDIGDLLLVEVSTRLKHCVRESDTVARLGGDEFVVILQELGESAIHSANQAETVAEKIVSILGEPYLLNNYEHHSGVSIGVCLFHGRDAKLEELLKRADTAMYQAKQGGRNMVRFFESAMQIAVEERAKLEGRLRHALARQELEVYYQLQVNDQFQVTGAEALLRWFNAEQGFVAPVQFIPIAEESGLILSIGAWVLETACQQLHVWAQHAGTRQLQLAVNVSARQFRQADFVGQVEAILRRFAFDPSRLKLELTESVVLVDINDTIAKMGALKKLGVKLSMDDFGTGYSSLSYLKMLPLDQLKIDQSFVRDIVVDKNDEVIVCTIIDMARNFGLSVIAEGVETREQLEILQRNGCPNYQGHYFSKPVPLKDFEVLLAQALHGPLKANKFTGMAG
jgi:diguanylate cyclase (GGDEF)-like protein/PAS domain S-box-containing protein